jgi:hypothetical protein
MPDLILAVRRRRPRQARRCHRTSPQQLRIVQDAMDLRGPKIGYVPIVHEPRQPRVSHRRMREGGAAHRAAFIRRGRQELADRLDGPIGQVPRCLPRDPAVVRCAWQTQRLEERANRRTLCSCAVSTVRKIVVFSSSV